MIARETIEALAERTAPDRCFVSVYAGRDDLEWLRGRLDEPLVDAPTTLERENLEPTLEMVREWVETHEIASGAVGLFACWADDYLEAVGIGVPVEPRVVVDSSPFVLPLAEVADEYESWCIVLADHDAARLFEVTGLAIEEVDRAAGNIKNSVKVGGWSQQRYERRRLKQISDYCDEVADRLDDLVDQGGCDRIVLAGSESLIATLEEELPPRLADRVVGAEILRRELNDHDVFEALKSTYRAAERSEERDLLEAIQERRYRDGRAAIGPEATLAALREGRVQTLVVESGADLKGVRCRECEWLDTGISSHCSVCGEATFAVELANEFVELANRTSADVDVAAPTDQLDEWGGVAALLRY